MSRARTVKMKAKLYDNLITKLNNNLEDDSKLRGYDDEGTMRNYKRIMEMEQDRINSGAAGAGMKGNRIRGFDRTRNDAMDFALENAMKGGFMGGGSKTNRKKRASSKTPRKVYKQSSKKGGVSAGGAMKKRKPSEYNLFVKKHIKAGGTMKSAAKEWRAYKKKHHIKPKVKKVKKAKRSSSKTSKKRSGSKAVKKHKKSKSKTHKKSKSHKK